MGISIHTPAKGVTVQKKPEDVVDLDFNPHSREGSDNELGDNLSEYSDFNPHSREGSDKMRFPQLPDFGIFQSTLPRRE